MNVARESTSCLIPTANRSDACSSTKLITSAGRIEPATSRSPPARGLQSDERSGERGLSLRINLYGNRNEDGRAKIQVRLHDESVWMTGAAMSELFQITRPTITSHLNRIFSEGELLPTRVIRYHLTSAADGKRYKTGYYNLEAVLSVGYRVRSHRGTQFRQWATERLRDDSRSHHSVRLRWNSDQ